jgi:choline dehydrogenase
MAWNFFVQHWDDKQQAERDVKYNTQYGGVLYPRSGAVGGCSAHNAMITVYPNDSDWNAIASLTGDQSWRADNMRHYFERLERCTYRGKWLGRIRNWPLVAKLAARLPAFDTRGHGFDGWLPTSIARPSLLAKDWQLVGAVASAAEQELGELLGRSLTRREKLSRWWFFDPNIAAVQKKHHTLLGLWFIPLAVFKGVRRGTREPLLETAAAPDSRLQIRTGCLATRLILDDANRCTGVEYLTGGQLYEADPRVYGADPGTPPKPAPATERIIATREVIVAGGTFNTPQLLKLSGIGPAEELRAFGIDPRVDLPGVGENLQDRYEVTVVSQTAHELALLKGGTFHPSKVGDAPDRLLAAWRKGRGPYTTNGGLLAVVASSRPELAEPDLFLFALPADFRGYYVDYAAGLERNKNKLTWAILKAHTENRAGSVRLRSADPCQTPDIRFKYFEEGSDTSGRDLDAVVAGVKLARRLTRRIDRWGDAEEVFPGNACESDDEIRQHVRDNAWGHHACGTCAIGADGDPRAVLDSRFRVRGVQGLRVVDASVFPRIPGYFIVSAVYMISEKAADVILADAK